MLKHTSNRWNKYLPPVVLLVAFIVTILIINNMNVSTHIDYTDATAGDSVLYDIDGQIEEQDKNSEAMSTQEMLNDAGHVGSLEIIDTDIKYPIMFSHDLTYYTQHNSNNATDDKGAIFLDARVESTDANVILIHGLTTDDGDMFSELWNYCDDDEWFDKYNTLTMNFGDVSHNYKIFCVVKFSQNDPIVHLNCETDEEFIAFYDALVKDSYKASDLEPNPEKQMVLLNTMRDDEHVLIGFMEE